MYWRRKMERINRKHKEINLIGEQKDLKKLLEEQNHALKNIRRTDSDKANISYLLTKRELEREIS